MTPFPPRASAIMYLLFARKYYCSHPPRIFFTRRGCSFHNNRQSRQPLPDSLGILFDGLLL